MGEHVDPNPQIEEHYLEPSDGFPNNPSLPLLLYRGALASPGPEVAEQTLGAHGWGGCWRDGVYSFHHFHSNAHEVLVVCSGGAEVRFGGPDGPAVSVSAGDVAVLPAGTAHKKENSTADFLVVGGYPAGQQNYDMQRGDSEEAERVRSNIAEVPMPEADPIYGSDGPLTDRWRGDGG